MPTPKRGPRLGGGPAHQKQMMANLATDLIRHGRIKTTETKAKTLRPYAEKLITKAKTNDLHSRRQVLSKLHDRDVVAYLFEEVAPRFVDRPGGYTRILKLGPRPGDNAPMAIIELVDRGEGSGEEAIEEGKQARSRGLFGRRRRKSAPAEGGSPAILEDEESEESVEDSSEDAGLEAQVPDEGPAQTPSAPDDPAVGNPVDEVDDNADAGEASGKDAGA